MENDIEKLRDFLPDLNDNEEKAFKSFFDILCHFNKKINLVSRLSIKEAGSKHFADSYLGLKIFSDQIQASELVYDFGSGNGFPGAIAAICFPNTKFLLVERDKRKSQFLEYLCQELELKNVILHAGEASDLKESSVKMSMSRAMAPLPKYLLELRRLVPKGGKTFLFKGESWTTEFGGCPPQIFDLWDVKLRGSYSLPESDAVRFIVECDRL